MPGGGVDGIESLQANVQEYGQVQGQGDGRHAADGEAGGGAHLVGIAPRDLAIRIEDTWQGVRLASVVAGDQSHDGLFADEEDQRLDDGAQFDA